MKGNKTTKKEALEPYFLPNPYLQANIRLGMVFEFLFSGKITEYYSPIEISEYRKEWKRKVPDKILNISELFK